MDLRSDSVHCLLMPVAAESNTGLSLENRLPMCRPYQMQVVLSCAYRYRCIWYLMLHCSVSSLILYKASAYACQGTAKFCHLETVTWLSCAECVSVCVCVCVCVCCSQRGYVTCRHDTTHCVAPCHSWSEVFMRTA